MNRTPLHYCSCRDTAPVHPEWHSSFSGNLTCGTIDRLFLHMSPCINRCYQHVASCYLRKNAANAIIFFKYSKIQFSRFVCLFWSWVVCFSMHPKYLPILFHVFVRMHVYTCTCIVCRLNFFSVTFFLCWMLCITCLLSFTLLDLTKLPSVYHCYFCIAFFHPYIWGVYLRRRIHISLKNL